jgi:hypothetical protein
MEIKKCGIVNIEKKKRMIFIVAEFYIKLSVFHYVRNFLLIKFPFNFEIIHIVHSEIILIRFINLLINVNTIFISFIVTDNFSTKSP